MTDNVQAVTANCSAGVELVPEFAAWESKGLTLAQEHRLRQFAIADWLLEGCGLCSGNATAVYDTAERLFPQYARQTFLSWVTVARHFPPSIRVESEFLTFKHYQVVQGLPPESHPWRCMCRMSGLDACVCPPFETDKQLQTAKKLVWLRKADERRMSVSLLRSAIANADTLRTEPEPVPEPEPKPEPEKPEKPEKPKLGKWTAKEAKRLEQYRALPEFLEKRTRWAIEELARARRVRPDEIVLRAVQDYIDAHTDELGNAIEAKNKREAEERAARAAVHAETEEERKLFAELKDKIQEELVRKNARVEAAHAARKARKQAEQEAREAELRQVAADALKSEAVSVAFPDDEPGFATADAVPDDDGFDEALAALDDAVPESAQTEPESDPTHLYTPPLPECTEPVVVE